MRILIADSFSAAHLDELRALGLEVDYQPGLTKGDLPSVIGEREATALVVRSTEVTAATLEAARGLRLVIRAGAGVNTIDVKAASARGVAVANCPGKNSIAVAELTMGLLISLDRRIPDNVAELRAGRWNKKEFSKARGLHGRTLGLIGLGSIGCEVAVRARAFGMRLVGFDPALAPQSAAALGVELQGGVASVCAISDVVSVHVPLSPATRHLIDEAAIAALRPGTFFLNTSRAEVVDGAALRRAITDKQLRVALDVFDQEPTSGSGAFSDDVVSLPGVYGTHHIGASTDQAQEAIGAETVRIVRAFVERGDIPNRVN